MQPESPPAARHIWQKRSRKAWRSYRIRQTHAPQLPMPWEEQYSYEYDMPYFWNPDTGDTQWERPRHAKQPPPPVIPTARSIGRKIRHRRREVIRFGLHKGRSIGDIMDQHPAYIQWCRQLPSPNDELQSLISAAASIQALQNINVVARGSVIL